MKKTLIRITTVPASMKSLLQGQLKFMQKYYDVIAISSDGNVFDEMLQEQGNPRNYKVQLTRKITPWQDLKALFILWRIFKKEKPFIVHTHTPKAGTIGMWAAWLAGVPNRLHTVAGLPLLVATGRKRMILNVVEKLTYAAATKVYPNSFRLLDIIEDLKFTRHDKLKVIGNGSSNGIDTEFFSKEAVMTDKNAYNTFERIYNNNLFTFCFVGRIVSDKGINELVKAFIRVHEQNPKTRLILVGPFEDNLNPVLPEVKNEILHHNDILFMDFQKDVRPFMLASDAFVFPSYREGFPNVVMQAGALGLPQIVTNINGCNEIIIEGENGTIIPVGDESALHEKMMWMINNDLTEMRKKAREMITSRYERKDMWKALLAEYQSL